MQTKPLQGRDCKVCASLRPLPFCFAPLAGAGLGCIHDLVQAALGACLLRRASVQHLAIQRPVGIGLYLAAPFHVAPRLALCPEPGETTCVSHSCVYVAEFIVPGWHHRVILACGSCHVHWARQPVRPSDSARTCPRSVRRPWRRPCYGRQRCCGQPCCGRCLHQCELSEPSLLLLPCCLLGPPAVHCHRVVAGFPVMRAFLTSNDTHTHTLE